MEVVIYENHKIARDVHRVKIHVAITKKRPNIFGTEFCEFLHLGFWKTFKNFNAISKLFDLYRQKVPKALEFSLHSSQTTSKYI